MASRRPCCSQRLSRGMYMSTQKGMDSRLSGLALRFQQRLYGMVSYSFRTKNIVYHVY